MAAANIGEDLLPSLSRDDIKYLFPGPENFLRRWAIWLVVNKDEKIRSVFHSVTELFNSTTDVSNIQEMLSNFSSGPYT